ncbi:MAG: NACHT domain-containing protein [Synechococcales cyanobacterium CRU_2_2]|nr:NACHT domain-containing protein [Synechococcales cyanobacterium CRU_2_2]
MAIDLFFRILELLSGQQMIQDKLQRTELVIRILKQVGLDPEHPPADFEGVYNYALVEYGVGKPKPCLELFRQREIRQVFRGCFDQGDGGRWIAEGEAFWAGSALGDAIGELGLSPRQELAEFAGVFLRVTRRSRTPKETLMGQQLRKIEQTIDRRFEQLGAIVVEQGALAGGAVEKALATGVTCRAAGLGAQLREWFEILGYRFESYERWEADHFEWVINIPVRRGRYDRVLVRGVDGEVGVQDVRSLAESVTTQKADEGWIVTARRISQAARGEVEKPECDGLAAYTLDELLDQDADFSSYLDWLGEEIERRRIETRYVPLACTKEEVDPVTHQRLGISRYGADDGWTEGYIDRWLDDPAKEHLSILGEFGTGKTWLSLHYAARVLRQYREAQSKGMSRPRLPIVVPLRDYAKAVSVESLFSEFFFRKHEIPIPGYSAFEQLNRMGKLLLIFDGFDEMAARVDKQQMINNFWELAKVVVPGSKVVLTCRTEHFPEAREGRSLLNAELQASTKGLTGETPQFEVLELEKFEDGQIRQVLALSASEGTVAQVMGNPQLLDLARRPVMTELILEALPEIEAGKPVDMSRVYLYAVRRKMERDIKAERTFTSMADKLYFLCELSWEMLSNDRMSINYREFPDRIRKLFGSAVQEEKDLDHWHYDMMGQTMLIRNVDGDYTPAHRSLLEFFVAFKFAADLGALAPDFLELAQMKSGIDHSLEPREYTWSAYFGGGAVAPLKGFVSETLEVLRSGFGAMPISPAILELLILLLGVNAESALFDTIALTRHQDQSEVGWIGGNAITVMVQQNAVSLISKDLSHTVLQGADFTNANLRDVNLTAANLAKSTFTQAFGTVLCSAVSPDGMLFATGEASGSIHLWSMDLKQRVQLNGHGDWVRSLTFNADGTKLISTSSDQTIKIWDITTATCIQTLSSHRNRVYAAAIAPDDRILASGGADCTIKIWDFATGECLRTITGHTDSVWSVGFSADPQVIISSSRDRTIRLWNWETGECLQTIAGNFKRVSFAHNFVRMSLDRNRIMFTGDDTIQIFDIQVGEYVHSLAGHTAKILCLSLSPDKQQLASSSYDQTIRIWDLATGQCLQVFDKHTDIIRSVTFHPNGKFLLSGSDDRTIVLWDLDLGTPIMTRFGQVNAVNDISLSPDGRYLVNTNDDETISLWDLDRGQYLRAFQGHRRRIWSVAISPDGKYLVSASSDRTIKIWDFATGECIRTIDCIRSIFGVAISPDSKMILSSGSDLQTILWDLETGESIREIQTRHRQVSESGAIALSRNFIASSSQTDVNLWSKATGENLITLSGHQGSIWAIAIAPDETWLVSGAFDTTVKLWDIPTGDLRFTLEGHTDRVRSLDINVDGNLIASAGDDAEIRLWSAKTGICHTILTGHQSRVRVLAFHPNGQWLVSGSFDETIRVWDINTGECLKTLVAKLYAGMNITGVKGLTPATIASLKALGAVENEE